MSYARPEPAHAESPSDEGENSDRKLLEVMRKALTSRHMSVTGCTPLRQLRWRSADSRVDF